MWQFKTYLLVSYVDCTKFQIYEVLIKKLYQISKQRNVHEMENSKS